jgi:hypothetical protein
MKEKKPHSVLPVKNMKLSEKSIPAQKNLEKNYHLSAEVLKIEVTLSSRQSHFKSQDISYLSPSVISTLLLYFSTQSIGVLLESCLQGKFPRWFVHNLKYKWV